MFFGFIFGRGFMGKLVHAHLLLLICNIQIAHSLVKNSPLPLRSTIPMSALRSGITLNAESSNLRGGEETSDSPRSTDSNKWVPSPSAELHDNINLIVLTALGLSSVWALYIGEKFFGNLLTWVGFVYIALDSLWLIIQPSIVKSPRMILGHHIATLLVLLDPLLQPSHSVYTSACLLVEVTSSIAVSSRRSTPTAARAALSPQFCARATAPAEAPKPYRF